MTNPIRFADNDSRPQVWNMWKRVFGDGDDYMRLYFSEKYRNENTLLYFEGDKAVASLQMLPYRFTFCGTEIPILYLSGVCTLPEARRKGYMERLLLRSFDVAADREVPLMLLVPQEAWLLDFYGKYGFAQTFDAGTELLQPSLKEIIESSPDNLPAAYQRFDACYRGCDMTVQKSYDDFRVMVREAALSGFPPKKNLIGMARMIDLRRLLSLFADAYPDRAFSVEVQDNLRKQNSGRFTVSNGKLFWERRKMVVDRGGDGNNIFSAPVGLQRKARFPSDYHRSENNRTRSEAVVVENTFVSPIAIHADIRQLTQLLMGYHTSEKAEPCRTLFPEKRAQMHRMLE